MWDRDLMWAHLEKELQVLLSVLLQERAAVFRHQTIAVQDVGPDGQVAVGLNNLLKLEDLTRRVDGPQTKDLPELFDVESLVPETPLTAVVV